MKKIAFLAYSRTGMALARRAAAHFPEAQIRCYAPSRLVTDGFLPEEDQGEHAVGQLFSWADALIFIGALGIAVRRIAPYVRDKRTDPAVLCLDERGRFVISVLSGHIGGANQLAQELAKELGSVPVITTATDINHLFSVDTWAREQGLAISDMHMAKAVSAAILEQDVFLASDFPIRGACPPGCSLYEAPEEGAAAGEPDPAQTQAAGISQTGILISWQIREPFERTLRLIPKILHLGIGCRKGTPKEQIAGAVRTALAQTRIDPRAVKGVYSITLKAEEEGLLQYCREMDWPFTVYTAEELMQLPGHYTASELVLRTTGADNICERAAMIGADHLILNKTICGGVTAALAAEAYEVNFHSPGTELFGRVL